MPPTPDPLVAVEHVLRSAEDAISGYKVAILRAKEIHEIRQLGESLRSHERFKRDFVRVRARLLAKMGTWGRAWEPRERLAGGTALCIGALAREEGMFEILARAEDRHRETLMALRTIAEGRLARDVQELIEAALSESEQKSRDGVRVVLRTR